MSDEREGLPSASGAEIFVNCAASQRLQAMVEKVESADPLALDGSVIHAALEREDGSELTMDQAEIATKLSEIEKQLYHQWREDFPIEDRGQVIREERFWIRGEDGQKTGSAKPDVVYIVGDHALCIDYKATFSQLKDASSNIQGRVQAISICQNHPEVTHIRVAFAQFRLSRFFTYCDYTVKDLDFALKEWNLAVWRSQHPDAPAIPGTHCRFCRAKSICRAAAAYSLLPATTVPGMLKTDKVAISNAITSLSHSDLVAIHERGSIIKNVLDAVSARLKALPVEELKALGLELKPGSKYISKVDVNAMFQLLWDDGFWNDVNADERMAQATTDFSTCSTVQTGKLSDLVVAGYLEQGRFKTKKAAEEHLKDLLAQVSTQETKEPTLRRIKE